MKTLFTVERNFLVDDRNDIYGIWLSSYALLGLMLGNLDRYGVIALDTFIGVYVFTDEEWAEYKEDNP